MQSDGLKVNYGKLYDFGFELCETAKSLNQKLDLLSDNVDKIPDAWPDDNGILTTSMFTAFIASAKPINAELSKLGQYAQSCGSEYKDLVTKYANMMR